MKRLKFRTEYILAAIAGLIVVVAAGLFFFGPSGSQTSASNPLAGKSFYRDSNRNVDKLAAEYRKEGKTDDAKLIDKIASQPDAIWLTGPSDNDPQADSDIEEVTRTSAAARSQGKVAVYQLYAIPDRDACAEYSAGGFENKSDYLAWIDRINAALRGEAVFTVEADAVAHAAQGGCMSDQERDDRYDTIRQALGKLKSTPDVLGTYLDAGHPEWLDVDMMTGPLKAAGVEQARGVVVNVSNFVDTDTTTEWSGRLAEALGGQTGVMIDTSRNGQGGAPANDDEERRWCNPDGRGLGPVPTTDTGSDHVDAYMYIKTIGESDGSCRGNEEAGTFVPKLALELARNANQ